MTNYFPLHNENPTGIVSGAPPETPLMLKQSQDRLKALGIWRTGLIGGVDKTTISVNNALSKLTPNSPEFVKLALYMQRCIEHKNRILNMMERLAAEEINNQKFMEIWIKQQEIQIVSAARQAPVPAQQTEPAVDPNLPLGPDGKPVGKMRSDGAIDITSKSTTLPVNGQLTPEQAKELGVTGPVGPISPIPVLSGGVISEAEQRAYIQAEEAKAKEPAKNIGGHGNGSPVAGS